MSWLAVASSPRAVEDLELVGWQFILEHERELGQQFLTASRMEWTPHRLGRTMEDRVPTFVAITHDGEAPGARWRPDSAGTGSRSGTGTTTLLEVMRFLGLPDGAGARRDRPYEYGGSRSRRCSTRFSSRRAAVMPNQMPTTAPTTPEQE